MYCKMRFSRALKVKQSSMLVALTSIKPVTTGIAALEALVAQAVLEEVVGEPEAATQRRSPVQRKKRQIFTFLLMIWFIGEKVMLYKKYIICTFLMLQTYMLFQAKVAFTCKTCFVFCKICIYTPTSCHKYLLDNSSRKKVHSRVS